MSRYPNEVVARFDQQFAETEDERNERLAAARRKKPCEAPPRFAETFCSQCGNAGVSHCDQHKRAERKIVTEFWMKPVPVRDYDWIAYYDGDEPNDAGWMVHGTGRTEAAAIADLKDNYDE